MNPKRFSLSSTKNVHNHNQRQNISDQQVCCMDVTLIFVLSLVLSLVFYGLYLEFNDGGGKRYDFEHRTPLGRYTYRSKGLGGNKKRAYSRKFAYDRHLSDHEEEDHADLYVDEVHQAHADDHDYYAGGHDHYGEN